MSSEPLSAEELERMRDLAATLMPGLGSSPPAAELPELDRLLHEAAAALGRELNTLRSAIALLPRHIRWGSLARFSEEEPDAFELVSTVAAGAYFMSPIVLQSIGYPTGERSAPPFDLAASELESGVLDPVQSSGPRFRGPEPERGQSET